MKQITIEPNTNRLRQLVRDHGDVWNEITSFPMSCFNGGLGVQIMSLDMQHIRNVPITIVRGG